MTRLIALIVLLPSLACASPASLRLLPGARMADGQHLAALEVTLKPGWKTYWRSPPSGIAPSLSFEGSSNIAALSPVFPAPEIIAVNGSEIVGYRDRLVLPLVIALKDPDAPADLRLTADLGICEDVCLPLTKRLEATLPAIEASTPVIAEALDAAPLRSGPYEARCSLQHEDGTWALTARVTGEPAPARILIETGSERVWPDLPQTVQHGAAAIATTKLHQLGEGPLTLERDKLVLTLLTPSGAFEVQGCPG